MTHATLLALRALIDTSGLRRYPVRLAFERTFTRGPCAGGTHHDAMGFCEEADAEEWIASVNRSHAAGRLDYRVSAWRFFR